MRVKMRLKTLFFYSMLPLAFSHAAIAQLSDVKQGLNSYIEAKHSESIELLEKVVNINSGTQNFAGATQIGEFFSEKFKALGMETQWIDGASWDRVGHLVAQKLNPNSSAPHLLLIGPLDTVFQIDSRFQSYQYLGDNIASELGITDIKGGDVIILQALAALSDQDLLDGMSMGAANHYTINETGDLESIRIQAQRTTVLIHRLSQN
tara:strand:+ start:1471 stop:2091 length:621 start_codon:yes stop_codon:yes gene_type:complete